MIATSSHWTKLIMIAYSKLVLFDLTVSPVTRFLTVFLSFRFPSCFCRFPKNEAIFTKIRYDARRNNRLTLLFFFVVLLLSLGIIIFFLCVLCKNVYCYRSVSGGAVKSTTFMTSVCSFFVHRTILRVSIRYSLKNKNKNRTNT